MKTTKTKGWGQMANKRRLPMRKIKEILRLKYDAGMSYHQIARGINVSTSTVHDIINRFNKAGLSWPLSAELEDEKALEALLYLEQKAAATKKPEPDMKLIYKELKRKSVTLQLLWEEYKDLNPDGYQYSYFCERFNAWRAKLNPVLRQFYRAGERTEVDYAGQTMRITDPDTGKTYDAYIFVAALAASNYIYAEAVLSVDLKSWIASHVRAFEFFGGATEITVPDNPKTGVHHPCRYEPELNRTYEEMASYYGTAVIPARVKRPRDKPNAENGVLNVERRIIAKLRNRIFFSLTELNQAIWAELKLLNEKPFQKLDGSRQSLYEELEKPALKPLPPKPFEYAVWKKLTVNIDYHVEVNKNYYSTPYQLVKEIVEVRITASVVEIFHRGKRVASHRLLLGKGKFSTLPEHRPASHQKYLEWTPSRITGWAAQTGPNTKALAAKIMENKPHPEQGYRSCLGLIRLGDRYGKERLENACARALAYDTISYKSVSSILKHGLDSKLPTEKPEFKPVVHENIRGADYYSSGGELLC
jgi:transposase